MQSQSTKRHYTKSSSFVMAAFFTILCGMAALCLGYFIHFFAKGHFVHSTEAVLDSQIAYIKNIETPPQGIKGEYIYRFLEEGNALPDPIPEQIQRFAEGIIVFDHPANDRRYAAKIYSDEDGRKLLIGFDITDISHDFQRMEIMGIFSIIFVMIVVFASYLISVFVVSGTNKIASTANEIMQTGDLSRRLEFQSRWDDLSNMAAVLNALLTRIEELMNGVRRVSDNIAHDLRTPLTRMRNHIETLHRKYGDSEHAELLGEADHILSTFTALLRISRIETEKQRSHFQALDLQTLLSDVVEFYEPLAEEKEISLELETSAAPITGDRDLLFQAYANILDNALKFTPEQGRIRISLSQDTKGLSVCIEDSGPGVAEGELSKIFDRFYRAEQSRTGAGTGLGLSLVRAVIELHGGSIRAENTPQGFRILTIL